MRPPMPVLDGVEHAFFDLETGVRAHVASAGPADAPAVVALHGWPQHWWCWREVIPRLSADFRVLCPDMRGFGWSGWPDDGAFEKQRVADDLIALLDVLGIERAVLAGHDWGGYAVVLAALRAPERVSAVLTMSVGHPWQPPARVLRNLWRFAYQVPLAAPLVGETLVGRGWAPRFVLEQARRDGVGWAPGDIDTYLDALDPPASSRLYRHFLLRETPRAALGGFRGRRLTMPVRLLHGTRDPLGREVAMGLERHADDGVVEFVERAGHFLPEEAPELVADRIRGLCG
jgi:pimeloyl-ACP methyl ester carboxylesterase